MATTPTQYTEGQTATNPKTGERVVFRKGMWVRDTSAPTASAPTRPKTTAADQKAVNEGSARAQAERDTGHIYDQAEQAVKRLDTGPVQSWWMDAITPEPDGGVMDGIGAFLGTPFRWAYDSQDWADRDHLNTVNANAAIAASANVKGAASDRDMALMRLTGLQTGKTKEENLRIINEARRQSALSQWRERLRSQWVTRFGSLSAPAPSGASFEEVIQGGEEAFNAEYSRRSSGKRGRPKAPPQPSRSSSQSSGVTIDLNGNIVR